MRRIVRNGMVSIRGRRFRPPKEAEPPKEGECLSFDPPVFNPLFGDPFSRGEVVTEEWKPPHVSRRFWYLVNEEGV